MTSIYLWTENEWEPYFYEDKVTKNELLKRKISIAPSVKIRKGAKFTSDTIIGANTRIGCDSLIWHNTRIGDDVNIGDNVLIGHDTNIGSGTLVGGYTLIGDNVHICSKVVIETDVRIGNLTVINNYAKIKHNVNIISGATIGAGEVAKKSIVICGSCHTVSWCGTPFVYIGCIGNTIDWWLCNYQSEGHLNNYSKAQIKEYHNYLIAIKQLYELEKNK